MNEVFLHQIDWTKTRWIYFSEDYLTALEVKDKFSELGASEIHYTEALNHIAREIKPQFIDLIGAIGKSQPFKEWIISSIAEKNSASTIYPDICRALYIKDYLLKNDYDGVLVIICAREGLLKILYELFPDAVYVVSSRIKSYLQYLYLYIGSRYYFILKAIKSRIKSKKIPRPKRASIILHTWLTAQSYDSNGEFNEIYHGDLYKVMVSNNIDVALLIWVISEYAMANLAEEINNKQSKVICFESYINIFDVVILLVKGFVSKCLKFNNVKLNGLDISPILNEAAAIDKAHNRYSIYYQENVLIKKLFTAGWNIERFIYPMENQPWERVLCFSIKKYFPNCIITAYQHATLSPQYLFYCQSTEEKEYMPQPDIILTTGEIARNYLKSYGYKAIIEVGGALRYKYLFEESKKSGKHINHKTVLVPLSFNFNLTLELLQKITKYCERNENIKFIVKPHPCMPLPEYVYKKLRELRMIEVRNELIRELLLETDVVLYMDTVVCIEAIASGIPVIHVVPEYMIDIDPLEDYPEMKMNISLLNSISENNLSLPKSADIFLNKYFTYPKHEIMKKFWAINKFN